MAEQSREIVAQSLADKLRALVVDTVTKLDPIPVYSTTEGPKETFQGKTKP
jgi:hypothetical protein